MENRPAKLVSASAIEYYPYPIFPNDLNTKHTIFGGIILAQADKLAADVAQRHSGQICVTARVDSVVFISPAREGEKLIFKAAVNRVWKTSMEIGVKVLAENYHTGEMRKVVSAYFTFASVDENLRPTQIQYLIDPQTPIEKLRYEKAEFRRIRRLEDRKNHHPS